MRIITKCDEYTVTIITIIITDYYDYCAIIITIMITVHAAAVTTTIAAAIDCKLN